MLFVFNLLSANLFFLQGAPLSTPPMVYETFIVNEGERHGVTVGETSPRGDIKEDTSSLIRFWILFS